MVKLTELGLLIASARTKPIALVRETIEGEVIVRVRPAVRRKLEELGAVMAKARATARTRLKALGAEIGRIAVTARWSVTELAEEMLSVTGVVVPPCC